MKKFNTSLRGYDKDEVNAFVNDIATNYEDMLNKLKQRDQELATLTEKLAYFENMESTLNRALLVAEEASNQIKRVANDESNLILEDAKKNASRIVNNALMKAEKIEIDAENIKRKVNIYKKRIKQLLEEQIELIDDFDKIDI